MINKKIFTILRVVCYLLIILTIIGGYNYTQHIPVIDLEKERFTIILTVVLLIIPNVLTILFSYTCSDYISNSEKQTELLEEIRDQLKK